jgi:hypothetical protein
LRARRRIIPNAIPENRREVADRASRLKPANVLSVQIALNKSFGASGPTPTPAEFGDPTQACVVYKSYNLT